MLDDQDSKKHTSGTLEPSSSWAFPGFPGLSRARWGDGLLHFDRLPLTDDLSHIDQHREQLDGWAQQDQGGWAAWAMGGEWRKMFFLEVKIMEDFSNINEN